jgi:hypothetical protein
MTVLNHKFEKFDHKFHLLFTMMEQLLEHRLSPSTSTEPGLAPSTPSLIMKTYPVTDNSFEPFSVPQNDLVLSPEKITPTVPHAWTGPNPKITTPPQDTTPPKFNATVLTTTSGLHPRPKLHTAPTRSPDKPCDKRLRASKPLQSLTNLSRVAEGEPRVPSSTRLLPSTT